MDEKILNVLLDIQSNMVDIKKDMNEKFNGINERLDKLENNVVSIKTTLETKTNKHIELLVESHSNLVKKAEKLEIIADDVKDIKMTVNILEAVTQKNSYDINKLKIVK